MTSHTNRLPDESLHQAQNDFGSLKANQVVSLSKTSGDHEFSIEERLSHLPKIKARPGFDQRMAAAFAMEMERETLQRNRSWLKKNSNISLPDITTNFS